MSLSTGLNRPSGDTEEYVGGPVQSGESCLLALGRLTPRSEGLHRALQWDVHSQPDEHIAPLGGLLLGQVGAESRQPFCTETDGRKSPRPSVPVSAWQGF